jgi:hypothetical protein
VVTNFLTLTNPFIQASVRYNLKIRLSSGSFALGFVSRDSLDGTAKSYGLDGRGSIPDNVQTGSEGPPSLLSNEYRGLFPRG